MFRITTNTTDRLGSSKGAWRVMEGDNHAPSRLDNPNLFFPTKRQASAKCRDLNN